MKKFEKFKVITAYKKMCQNLWSTLYFLVRSFRVSATNSNVEFPVVQKTGKKQWKSPRRSASYKSPNVCLRFFKIKKYSSCMFFTKKKPL